MNADTYLIDPAVWNVNVRNTSDSSKKILRWDKPLVELQGKKILQNLSSSHQMSLLSSSTLHKKKYVHNLPIFRHFEIVFNNIEYLPVSMVEISFNLLHMCFEYLSSNW